jgi:hypothetical protein
MKATLEFSLPEERAEYHWASNAGKLHSAIIEFDGILRNRCKYGDDNARASELRSILYDCLQEEGITLYDI